MVKKTRVQEQALASSTFEGLGHLPSAPASLHRLDSPAGGGVGQELATVSTNPGSGRPLSNGERSPSSEP